MKRIIIIAVAALAAVAASCRAHAVVPPLRFVELDLHALAGGSSVTQNYMGTFPEIRELNSSMGAAYGVGAGAVFNFSGFLGLGTELNLTVNHNKIDMAVANDDATAVSNIFLRNRYWYANVPVYMSFRFSIAGLVRLNLDAGMYYSYGIAGRQKQTIYNSTVNDLGQLIPRVISTRPDYFNDGGTFINRFRRSDIGLHLGAGLTFGGHITVGARFQLGLKNVSFTDGVNNPNIHNINVMAMAGYKF